MDFTLAPVVRDVEMNYRLPQNRCWLRPICATLNFCLTLDDESKFPYLCNFRSPASVQGNGYWVRRSSESGHQLEAKGSFDRRLSELSGYYYEINSFQVVVVFVEVHDGHKALL